jgi:hypothetical protein
MISSRACVVVQDAKVRGERGESAVARQEIGSGRWRAAWLCESGDVVRYQPVGARGSDIGLSQAGNWYRDRAPVPLPDEIACKLLRCADPSLPVEALQISVFQQALRPSWDSGCSSSDSVERPTVRPASSLG